MVLVFRDDGERRRRAERQAFIAEAFALLGTSLDVEETLRTIARVAVPRMADWCAVDMLDENGRIARLAVEHVDPARVALAHELAERYPVDPDAPAGMPLVLRTGRSVWTREIPDDLLVRACVDEEQLRLARALGLRSYIVAPMTARGRTIGAISFVLAESERRYDEADLAVAEDLAARAAIAVDNARLFEAARRAAAQREELLAVVSHDLRNPLSTVVMAASLITSASSDPRARDQAERIRRSAEQMTRLINDLLDCAAIEARGLTVTPAPVAAPSLFEAALELLAPVAARCGVALAIDPAPIGAPLLCDRDRVLQILSNLVGNAARFTPDGGRITIGARPDGDRRARLFVRDTGAGIAPNEIDQLFERYVRGRDARAGTGLGLYIVKGIVEAHGGRAWIESELGVGTTVWFTLPLAIPA